MPSELTALLGDTSLTWTERRTRLQGWSGPEARTAPSLVAAMRTARHPDPVPHDPIETMQP